VSRGQQYPERLLDLDQKSHFCLKRQTHHHCLDLLGVWPHLFHLKVISMKSHLTKYKRCPFQVPLYPFHRPQEKTSSQPLPVGRLVISRKTKEREIFPYSAKTQNLLTKHNQILQGTEVITPKQKAHEVINIL
jgi:hypothetical protein